MKDVPIDSNARVLFTFIFLFFTSCIKGKDCDQLYHNVINIENGTSRNLSLEFVNSNNEPFTVEMKPLEKVEQKVVKEYILIHEGGFQKGGAPYDGQCSPEPSVLSVSSFLSEKSFGSIKHCWDQSRFTSVILETSDQCTSVTYEQKRPGNL